MDRGCIISLKAYMGDTLYTLYSYMGGNILHKFVLL